jgi:hypothetical protein
MICGKGEKKLKSISIGFDRIVSDALDMGEVLPEELMD